MPLDAFGSLLLTATRLELEKFKTEKRAARPGARETRRTNSDNFLLVVLHDVSALYSQARLL